MQSTPLEVDVLPPHGLRVVREAITSLGLVGPGAKAATKDLWELASSGKAGIAARAKTALAQIVGR